MAEALLKDQNTLLVITRVLVILICFPIHECAHAWVAHKLGDDTAKSKGRITLKPLKHLDYMGTLLVFLDGIGYAKSVPVNKSNFRNPKRDFAITAAAGPVSNLLMAILILVLVRFFPPSAALPATPKLILNLLKRVSRLNVSLAVFNLLPIFPLDGSRILMALLPDGASDGVQKLRKYSRNFLLITIVCCRWMGVSPTFYLSGKLYNFLYALIVS